MKILRFDHLHMNPADFDKFNESFQKFMGFDYLMNMPMEQYGTKVAYEPFPVGVEAFQVTDVNKSVSAKVASENSGVFCLSFRVENLAEAIKEMEEKGWKMLEYIDNAPIIEALFDTKADMGIYIELVETPFDDLRAMSAQMAQQ